MKNRIFGDGATLGTARGETASVRPRTNPAAAPPSQLRQSIENFAIEHPVASVTAAICVGVLLGWFIKRR